MTDPLSTPNNINFRIGPGHGKMTEPHTLTENFKFQILPRYEKMTDPPTLTETFKFQILLWTWKDALTPHPHQRFLNFGLGLDMERWPTPNPQWKVFKFQIWPGHGNMTNPPTITMKFSISDCVWTWLDALTPNPHWNNLNFRFGLDMEKMNDPHTLTWKY